jgi:hypothetical protein
MMTATLEQTDIFQTAFIVVDVNDYLDVRQSPWIVFEQAGAVTARDSKVYVSPDLSNVLSAVSLRFPAKYTIEGKRK